MSRHRRFSALVQDGNLSVSVVRVYAPTAAKAAVAAARKAEADARRAYPDAATRTMMTRDNFSVIRLFHGHLRDAVAG